MKKSLTAINVFMNIRELSGYLYNIIFRANGMYDLELQAGLDTVYVSDVAPQELFTALKLVQYKTIVPTVTAPSLVGGEVAPIEMIQKPDFNISVSMSDVNYLIAFDASMCKSYTQIANTISKRLHELTTIVDFIYCTFEYDLEKEVFILTSGMSGPCAKIGYCSADYANALALTEVKGAKIIEGTN